MNQLANGVFAFFMICWIAIKILADDDIGSQLAPTGGDLAVRLFKEHFAGFIFDSGASSFPLNGIERTSYLSGAESAFDL